MGLAVDECSTLRTVGNQNVTLDENFADAIVQVIVLLLVLFCFYSDWLK